jgi:integrase
MALTDAAVRMAKPSEKTRKLADEKGMYLLVQASGAKLWRMDYRFDAKRKTLDLGTYPETSLAQACDKRDEARKLLAQDIDPSAQRKQDKAERRDAQFDFDAALWRIPKEVIKMREAHIVPLSKQVIEYLKELHILIGSSRLLFPSMTNRDRPISKNTVTYALAHMGFKGQMTGATVIPICENVT